MASKTEDRRCVVLLQNRQGSEYNDFIGKFYHFPKKYINLLSAPPIEFVYYEPKKRGEGVYFGYGKIAKVFGDRREKDCFFAEIVDYRLFSKTVAFHTAEGEARESGPNYNAQNAIRKIRCSALDGICLDGGILLNFRADAHLLTVLGEQLISSEQVGVLELVKNAYDAGATECVVRIENVPALPAAQSEYQYKNLESPVIAIRDNGRGMTQFVIENGWLRPASTIKTDVKERLKEEKKRAIEKGSLGTFKSLVKALTAEYGGRLPLGEKGVGRFATHRLGKKVIIKTKTTESDYEYVLSIDWDEFEHSETGDFKDLDSIGVALFRQPPSRDYGSTKSGTEIICYSGRPEFPLAESTIRDLNRTLNRLRSPIRGPKDFNVTLQCPQLQDLADISYTTLFPPVFKIDAAVDEQGNAEIDLFFNPPRSVPLPSETIKKSNFSLRAQDKDYWLIPPANKVFRKPTCGSFFLHIDVWYRATPWIEGPEKSDFIRYLDDFGGISIFRDGLNIFPAEWGAEVDWLELSKRHIRSGDRISYREVMGNLEIEQSSNLDLVDKTDRQGMILNQAYRDLAKLVRAIILFVEVEFQGKRDKYNSLTAGLIREPRQLRDVSKQSATILGNVASKYDVRHDPLKMLLELGAPEQREGRLIDLNRSLKNLQKSLKLMEEVQEVLTEQAGYGISIAVSVHELAKITTNFYSSVSRMLKSKSIDKLELERLRDSSESLRTELKRLGPLRAVRNEKPTVFSINSAINFCHSLFERTFAKMEINFALATKDDFTVKARFGAIVQVITNLIDNSCYWLGTETTRERKIEIHVSRRDRTVLIGDSGPGIDDSIRPYLFQPGYSLREPASGLGLYICKHYMRTAGGDVYEAPLRERLTNLAGAQFVLDFSRVEEAD